MTYPAKGHPWADFLHHRLRAIKWSQREMGSDVPALARTFSCDPFQIQLLLSTAVEGDGREEQDEEDAKAARLVALEEVHRAAIEVFAKAGKLDPGAALVALQEAVAAVPNA